MYQREHADGDSRGSTEASRPAGGMDQGDRGTIVICPCARRTKPSRAWGLLGIGGLFEFQFVANGADSRFVTQQICREATLGCRLNSSREHKLVPFHPDVDATESGTFQTDPFNTARHLGRDGLRSLGGMLERDAQSGTYRAGRPLVLLLALEIVISSLSTEVATCIAEIPTRAAAAASTRLTRAGIPGEPGIRPAHHTGICACLPKSNATAESTLLHATHASSTEWTGTAALATKPAAQTAARPPEAT